MLEFSLFGLLFVAVAVGWYFGRHSSSVEQDGHSSQLPSLAYYQGINFLISEQPDCGIETFIQSLEVSSETFDLHISLGNLLRRRGEVDKAIRIHQNLLARPGLGKTHLNGAHLELARDYISAGLLDRAERLLEELVKESSEFREISLQLLVDIYQDEKEWKKALATAEMLRPKKRLKRQLGISSTLLSTMAHFYCEQADLALQQQNYRAVRELLRQAVEVDKNCVRASLISAELDLQLDQPRQAIKALRRVRIQDPDYIPETIAMLLQAHQALGERSHLLRYLQECLQDSPSTTTLLAITTELEEQQGAAAAAQYLGKQLKVHPSLKGVAKLIEYQLLSSDDSDQENIRLLDALLSKLIASKPVYQCRSCGFSGAHLHWLCPSCKEWGEVRLVKGVEGD